MQYYFRHLCDTMTCTLRYVIPLYHTAILPQVQQNKMWMCVGTLPLVSSNFSAWEDARCGLTGIWRNLCTIAQTQALGMYMPDWATRGTFNIVLFHTAACSPRNYGGGQDARLTCTESLRSSVELSEQLQKGWITSSSCASSCHVE